MDAATGKLQKSLARFKERHVNSKKYDSAVELLYQSSKILMEFGKFDEACDLVLYMIEIFEQEDKPLDEFKKTDLSKLVELVNVIPDQDANLSNLAKEISKFSTKKSGSEAGFPALSFVIGSKLYYSGSVDLINASEHYLLASGNAESLELLVDLEFGAYLLDEVDTFGLYLARLVIPYLISGNLDFASQSASKLIAKLETSPRSASFAFETVKNVKVLELKPSNDLQDCYGLVNFLQLLVEVCERSSAENASNFKLLVNRYMQMLERHGLAAKVNTIGESYFGVSVVQKSSNMLQEMMSGLLGGGGNRSIQ
ncbi:hypothetical protein OGAPHI_001844 [Ogataea philodendri]|uniref:Uncharacterized protein n=1 Tax=Ogataea philodendri TaxID=1378263 RepID=A0A9P8T7E3_9ASCO|nr:uncharacterized protein OGAPHI_001844 [Ogataea philodendri]KAH3668090.1 hypothetical protein OGAPHI_001844 [Ogataea philodendri]